MNFWSKIVAILYAVAVGTSMGITPSAFAQPRACEKDIQTYCEDVQQQGDSRAKIECLRANQDKLSVECREQIEKRRDNRQVRREVCKEDLEQFCSDISPRDRRALGDCLKANEGQISEACRATLR